MPEEEEEEDVPPTPQDLEYIGEIKRVLELLKKNRDMLFNEVKLTIMIEDPREEERKKLFGIDDPDAPTRDELAETLELVNEGKVPKDRLALRMLADEMTNWPNLEVILIWTPMDVIHLCLFIFTSLLLSNT
ncbi:Ycf3-interacting protein 1, chloroplastic [Linum grandiflorum]